ncbi:uncharacterized protein LOC130975353 [Arachis stenosperma]|uniref:uncharacterized protein LOC130975353 n=1 Tax=Arachis stenosperma TaxID=217475 RepID=UPI0025AD9585|nr:uncharacterized protein LOC130975353 [Arachis stenosperma]
MDMSKDWMDTPRHEKEYQVGVERFLHFAFSSKGVHQGEEIQCPCAKCCNIFWLKRDDVYDHLICHDFVKGYRWWFNHGESLFAMDIDSDIGGEYNCNDNIDELLRDRFRDNTQVDGQNMGPNECAKEFYKLVDEASQELYPGCKGFTRLSFTIRLYLLKCLHGWSNASFTSLLELLKEAMPYLNIPISFDKTKNMVKNLGLDYQKIDACRNDCMLYRNGYENDSSYHVCGTSCYIEHHEEEDDVTSSRKPRKVTAKTRRYFPLIPRLQRLFMCTRTVQAMSWHHNERVKDGSLRHPADGESWKAFDNRHEDFAKEPRNVRLGLASDGFNLFRTLSSTHSTWLVVLMVYNLPLWMSMKPDYFMLSLLILGPQSPENDIDVYLQPLIEELKELWESGVETYDSKENKIFNMRACLLWTINDFPAYAMLSGWSTKGKLACLCCNDETSSIYLKHSHKTIYMDHRRFLPVNHPWRHNKRSFNGKIELRSPPQLLEGSAVFDILREVDNSFGKKQKRSKNGISNWKKWSIFFYLPYWKSNMFRHNLDVIHIEKNIVDSIIGTLLDIPGKTKDHAVARFDLKDMGIRKNLQPKDTKDGKKTKLAKACFSMTPAEKIIFCSVLKAAKLLDGSASNIARCVHEREKKISGYKTHDAYFMLHYLLQVPIKSILPDHVAIALVRLCSFFRRICQKVISLDEVVNLEAEIAETLYQLERIFPPNFFDIMVHLPIHLANEVREHEEAVNDNNPRRTKWEKAKDRSQQFSEWFKIRAMKKDVPGWAKGFARGPNRVAKRISGYIINGYRFHTRHRDARRKTQNSGVTLEALTPSFASVKDKKPIEAKVAYYDRIVDMFELDYYGQFKVVLFKCEWEPCEPEVIPSLPNDNGEIDLVRNDLQATIIDMDPNMFAKQYCEEDEESKYEYMEDLDSETS